MADAHGAEPEVWGRGVVVQQSLKSVATIGLHSSSVTAPLVQAMAAVADVASALGPAHWPRLLPLAAAAESAMNVLAAVVIPKSVHHQSTPRQIVVPVKEPVGGELAAAAADARTLGSVAGAVVVCVVTVVHHPPQLLQDMADVRAAPGVAAAAAAGEQACTVAAAAVVVGTAATGPPHVVAAVAGRAGSPPASGEPIAAPWLPSQTGL